MKSKNPYSGFHEEQIAKTLDTRPDPTCNQGGNVIIERVADNVRCLNPWDCQSKRQHDINGAYPTLQAYNGGGGRCDGVVYAIKGNFIDRDTKQNGIGWRDGEMYTLNATDRHAVALDYRNFVGNDDLSSTLQAKSNGGQSLNYINPVVYDAVCVGNGQLHQTDLGDKAGALNCMHDQQAVILPSKPPRKYIVRRLTPIECARLQGFPDWWCEGLGGSDTAIYKAYGNGLALPCAFDVIQRIARFVEREEGGK